MSVVINDYTPKIEADINQKASIFLRFMTDEIVKNSTASTPKKTGRLRNDILKQVLGLKGRIIWGKNYAIYQEKKQYTNYTTPGTGPNFAENAVKNAVSLTSKIAEMVGLK